MLEILRQTFKTGTVTSKYPKKPESAPEGFRGRPELFPDKCTCCGECARVCPPGVIWVAEELSGKSLTVSYCGCIFCGMCEEVCPHGAIRLTRDYELASKTKEDLLSIIRRSYDG